MQRLLVLLTTEGRYVEHHLLDGRLEARRWATYNMARIVAARVTVILDYEVDADGRVPDGKTVYEQLIADGMPEPVKH